MGIIKSCCFRKIVYRWIDKDDLQAVIVFLPDYSKLDKFTNLFARVFSFSLYGTE